MAQQMVHATVYKQESAIQLPGILRLAGSVVKLPLVLIQGFFAGMMVGFRIFIDTAEKVGLPRS